MPDPEIIEESLEKEEKVEVETPEDNTLEMSDDEFEKLLAPGIVAVQEKEKETDSSDSTELETEKKKESEKKEDKEAALKIELEKDPENSEVKPTETLEKKKETDGSQSPEKPAEDKKEAGKTSSDSLDFESEYNRIMAPFKANGSEMKVKSAEDVRQLMKMGANYHKKMAGLKPSLKTLKLLEKNSLLDPDKVNFLIDLNNKNPEAIAKLLKDSGIDPLDINVKADSNYTPTNRTVSDTELTLDSVLEEIRDTPSYSRTLNVVTKEWDDTSRDAIATEPHIISIINGHIADGTFDKVMEAVTYERSLGRLVGVSDFDAYKKAGDTLDAAGKLQAGSQQNQTVTLTKATPDKKEIDRKKRKRAASPTKASKTTVAPSYDPLSMSDEDFAKFDINLIRNKK